MSSAPSSVGQSSISVHHWSYVEGLEGSELGDKPGERGGVLRTIPLPVLPESFLEAATVTLGLKLCPA